MHKGFLRLAAFLGALSVGLGAFGAHGLKSFVPLEDIETFDTGVRYQFYHVFALLATGILYKRFPVKRMLYAGFLFIAGIVLFSGSLYLLTILSATDSVGMKGIGFLTPLGGILLIIAWLFLLAGVSSPVRTHRSGQSSKI